MIPGTSKDAVEFTNPGKNLKRMCDLSSRPSYYGDCAVCTGNGEVNAGTWRASYMMVAHS